MPLPSWVKRIPIAGDILNLASEYGAGRLAGLDPVTASKRAAGKAGAGLAASLLPPADVLTTLPWALRQAAQARRSQAQSQSPVTRAIGQGYSPNPLRSGRLSPRVIEKTAEILDYANPEGWALDVVDRFNPELQGGYSLDPETRAEQIKQEMLQKAAKNMQ
jgi:hypothetical protein